MYQTLLYAAAIFGVVAFVLLLGLSGFIFKRIRMMRSEIDHNADMLLEDPYPPSLALTAKPDFELQDSDLISDYEAFSSLGFKEIGRFKIEELPLSLCAMRHPDQFLAIIYRHERGFGWSEIRTHYHNGDFQLVSNCPFGQDLLMPEFAERFYDETLEGEALFEEALQLQTREDVAPVDDEGFVALFQSCYRREYNWRIENHAGALEVAQMAADSPDETETSELVNALKEQHELRNKEVEKAILHGFLKQTPMTALQWEERRERIRVIHNYLGFDELCAYLNYLPFMDGKARETIQQRLENGEEPIDIFESTNERKPIQKRLDDIYRTMEPHRGTIYLMPAEEDD